MATLNSTMKKLTLKKFLFCVDLKTGGTILAWWSMITSPIWAFLNAILAYGDLVEIIQERADMIVMRTLIAVLLLVVSLLFVFNTHYSYELLKGIKQDDAVLMIPYIVIGSTFVVLNFAGLFISIFIPGLVMATCAYIVIGIFNIYICLVIWSLCVKIAASAESAEPTETDEEVS